MIDDPEILKEFALHPAWRMLRKEYDAYISSLTNSAATCRTPDHPEYKGRLKGAREGWHLLKIIRKRWSGQPAEVEIEETDG